MPRSNSNTGRKGASIPPEMKRMRQRLQRAYEDYETEHGKLTQKELSRISGVSQGKISELFSDDVPMPEGTTAAVIAKLCLALDVSPGYVLIGEGDQIRKLARRSESSPAQELRISEDEVPTASPPAQREPSPPAAPHAPPATPEQTTMRPAGRTPNAP